MSYNPGLHPQHNYCQLKNLIAFAEWVKEQNFPLDTPVCIERVQDVYFEKHGWDTFDHYEVICPAILMKDERNVIRDIPQNFFQAWGMGMSDDKKKILIHAHY